MENLAHKRSRGYLLLSAALSYFLTIQSALAVDTTADLLLKKGLITNEEYSQLNKQNHAAPLIDLSDGVKITSEDKAFSLQMGTLLQFDIAHYESNIEDTLGRDLANSGSEFRRIRFYIGGTLSSDWDYRTEIEFANNNAQLTLGYVNYHGFKNQIPLQITIGQFKIPFSQELLTVEKNTLFMERSLPNLFLNTLAPGVMLSTNERNWSSSFMLYGEQLSAAANSVSDEGGGISWRNTWSPLLQSDNVIHLGASLMSRVPSQNNISLGGTPITYGQGVRFRGKPESNIIETRLIDTGNILNVERTDLFGLELSEHIGSFGVESEYISTHIQRNNGLNDISFNGWYVQTSWVLTGEKHNYKGNKGIFDGVTPNITIDQNGIGAWEIAWRFSEVDLMYSNTQEKKQEVALSPLGAKEKNTTFALNWYLNRYLRSELNYIHVIDIKGGDFNNKKFDSIQLRLQLSY